MPCFAHVVSNRQALDLLKQIAPYLNYKARRTALILDRYLRLTQRNGKYSSQQRAEREAFVEQFLGLRMNSP